MRNRTRESNISHRVVAGWARRLGAQAGRGGVPGADGASGVDGELSAVLHALSPTETGSGISVPRVDGKLGSQMHVSSGAPATAPPRLVPAEPAPGGATSLPEGVALASGESRPRERARRHVSRRSALVLSDVAAICLSEVFALLWIPVYPRQHLAVAPLEYLLICLPLPVVGAVALAANGLYVRWPHQLLNSSFSELRDIVYALGVAGGLVLGWDHIWRSLGQRPTLHPLTVVLAMVFAVVLLPASRAATRIALRALAVEQARVIIVGSGMMARQLARYMSWDRRITILGYVDDEPVPGHDVLGGFDDLLRLCNELRVDQVVIGFSRTHPARAIERLRALKGSIAISIVPRYFELVSPRSAMREIAGLPLLEVAPPDLSLFARIVKRCFDIATASLAIVVSLPVLVAAACAVKMTSPGPVVFRQTRVGRYGRKFVMYKFRTMTAATSSVSDSLRQLSEVDGPLFKMKDDPRVTSIGRLLRKLSLDELPQLFNVLRGDMSMVGPRPFIPSESDQIGGPARRRFEVRPGLTGLWQISGRSQLSYDELARLDYLYVASWSLWWDMRILWHTPARVLSGRGAY